MSAIYADVKIDNYSDFNFHPNKKRKLLQNVPSRLYDEPTFYSASASFTETSRMYEDIALYDLTTTMVQHTDCKKSLDLISEREVIDTQLTDKENIYARRLSDFFHEHSMAAPIAKKIVLCIQRFQEFAKENRKIEIDRFHVESINNRIYVSEYLAKGNYKTISKAIDPLATKKFTLVRHLHANSHKIKKERRVFNDVKDIKGTLKLNSRAKEGSEEVWVTPYCDGGTLDSYLATATQTEQHYFRMLEFFTQVSGTISEFHSKDLLHADLHGANLMWKSTKKGYMDNKKAVVIDYGEVQNLYFDPLNNTKYTASSNLNGHIYYVSPEYLKKLSLKNKLEKIKKCQPVDTNEINRLKKLHLWKYLVGSSHDVWILGVTMYQAFHLKVPPWKEGMDLTKKPSPEAEIQMRKKMKKGFPEPADVFSVEHLIWEMLQYKPLNRPTMEQVSLRLKNIWMVNIYNGLISHCISVIVREFLHNQLVRSGEKS